MAISAVPSDILSPSIVIADPSAESVESDICTPVGLMVKVTRLMVRRLDGREAGRVKMLLPTINSEEPNEITVSEIVAAEAPSVNVVPPIAIAAVLAVKV